jgi:hypothetical protein
MRLSKEAEVILELINWVSDRNESPGVFIGYRAMLDALERNLEDEYELYDVYAAIEELEELGEVMIERIKPKVNKYWLISPVIGKFVIKIVKKINRNLKEPRKVILSCDNYKNGRFEFTMIMSVTIDHHSYEIAKKKYAIDELSVAEFNMSEKDQLLTLSRNISNELMDIQEKLALNMIENSKQKR